VARYRRGSRSVPNLGQAEYWNHNTGMMLKLQPNQNLFYFCYRINVNELKTQRSLDRSKYPL